MLGAESVDRLLDEVELIMVRTPAGSFLMKSQLKAPGNLSLHFLKNDEVVVLERRIIPGPPNMVFAVED